MQWTPGICILSRRTRIEGTAPWRSVCTPRSLAVFLHQSTHCKRGIVLEMFMKRPVGPQRDSDSHSWSAVSCCYSSIVTCRGGTWNFVLGSQFSMPAEAPNGRGPSMPWDSGCFALSSSAMLHRELEESIRNLPPTRKCRRRDDRVHDQATKAKEWKIARTSLVKITAMTLCGFDVIGPRTSPT